MTLIIVLLILSVLGNAFQLYFISNLFRQNNQLEQALKNTGKIEEDAFRFHLVILKLLNSAYAEMKRIDSKGAFASDDEVGFAFKSLQTCIYNTAQNLEALRKDLEQKDDKKEEKTE